MGDWEGKNLVNELIMGRQLTRQLQFQLNIPSSSRKTHKLLLQKILSSYEKALSMLNSGSLIHSIGIAAGMPYSSPSSLSESPRSDQDYDRDEDSHDAIKKRKNTTWCTNHVRVNPKMGLEEQLDDGFTWRKYGQKDIPGAKYPRGYYRCTHRIVQDCLAIKQVQQSDDDPTIFEIAYFGRHTCTQMLHHHDSQQQENQNLSQNLLSNFRSGLKVITEGSDHQDQSIPAFNFPSTSNLEAENHVISPSMADNNFMGSYSPSFVSPSASVGNANYFSASSDGMHHSFEAGNQSFQASDSDLRDVIATAAAANTTSAIKFTTMGVDFPFGNVDFDPKYFPANN